MSFFHHYLLYITMFQIQCFHLSIYIYLYIYFYFYFLYLIFYLGIFTEIQPSKVRMNNNKT